MTCVTFLSKLIRSKEESFKFVWTNFRGFFAYSWECNIADALVFGIFFFQIYFIMFIFYIVFYPVTIPTLVFTYQWWGISKPAYEPPYVLLFMLSFTEFIKCLCIKSLKCRTPNKTEKEGLETEISYTSSNNMIFFLISLILDFRELLKFV